MDFRNCAVLALVGVAVVVLSGCATVAVPVFSEIPIALIEPCDEAQCSLPGAKESTQYGYEEVTTFLGDGRSVRSLVPMAVGNLTFDSGAPPEKALAFKYNEGAPDVKACYCPLPL